MHSLVPRRLSYCQLNSIRLLVSHLSRSQFSSIKLKEDNLLPVPAAKRCDAVLDENIAKLFEDGLRARKHPGRRHLPCVSIPPTLEMAASQAIEKYRGGNFVADVELRQRQFHNKHLPAEEDLIAEKKKEIQDMIARKELKQDIDEEKMDEEEIDRRRQDRKNLEEKLLKKFVYNWTPVEYTDYESRVYMAARLPQNYAALRAVFHNIQLNDPNFAPRTVFDFGSGCGTVGWAVEQTWGENCMSEYFCVDAAQEQHELNRFILEESKAPNKQKRLDTLFVRQYLPVSHTIKYDMVVSAFSLLEQPNQRSRINIIENLWHKTQDMLVIIEHGTEDGFTAVLEARNLILQIGGLKLTQMYKQRPEDDDLSLETEDTQAHVVAPCPHDVTCPRQQAYGPLLCNFEIPFTPFNFGQPRDHHKIGHEPYSYIVLRKGPRVYSEDKPYMSWPRIIQPVLKRDKHVICRACCPDAKLGELRVSKGKTEKKLYRCVRVSQWGDYLPATLTEMEFDEEYIQRKAERKKRREEAKMQREESLFESN